MGRGLLARLIVLLLFGSLLDDRGLRTVQAEYQFNAIDSVYPLGNGINRYVINCAARSHVVFKAKHVETGEESIITIQCGQPVYSYVLHPLAHVPVDTTSVEVTNCAVQQVPDVYPHSVKNPPPLPPSGLQASPGIPYSNQSGSNNETIVRPSSEVPNSTSTLVEENIPASGVGEPKRRVKRMFGLDSIMGMVGGMLGGLFGGGGGDDAVSQEFQKIHDRDSTIKKQTDALSDTGKKVQSYINSTNAALTELNNKTNEAFNTLQTFVKDNVGQMMNKSAEMMNASTTQLNSILDGMEDRINQLMAQTTDQLNEFQSGQIQARAHTTYAQMISVMRSQMSVQWGFAGKLMASVTDLGDRDKESHGTMDELKETLLQLQYHQYGIGPIARSYHRALASVTKDGWVPFLGSYGRSPKSSDDFFMVIDKTNIVGKFCDRDLYLVCRRSTECHWYIQSGPNYGATSCNVQVQTSHMYGLAKLENGRTFSMLKDQKDPDLKLKKSAVLLEIRSIYGSNQTGWGATLGDGLVTTRLYSLFIQPNTYMSKCDKARFGAFKNEWVPIHSLAYYDSRVVGARASYSVAGLNVTVNAAAHSQWLDPFKSMLPKNDDLYIYHTSPAEDGNGYNIYNVPPSLINLRGPVSTRIGKIGYFTARHVPNDTSAFYEDWTASNGTPDPKAFAVSVGSYKTRSASNTAFCGDVAQPEGLCALSMGYEIDWKTQDRRLNLKPKTADMQLIIDLPFDHPQMNSSHLCPPVPQATGSQSSSNNSLAEVPNYQLKCNDATCALHLRNPFEGTGLRLGVYVNHFTNPSCSYSFPVYLPAKQSLYRTNAMTLNLQTCVGDFEVLVMSGNLNCWLTKTNRAEMPAMEELASYIMFEVTQETNNLVSHYQRLMDSVNQVHQRKQVVTQDFSRFFNFSDQIELQTMSQFNMSQMSVTLQQIYEPPLNTTSLMNGFNISLNLETAKLVQTDFTAVLQQRSDAVAAAQAKVQSDIDAMNMCFFDMIPCSYSGYLYVILGAMLVGVILMTVFKSKDLLGTPSAGGTDAAAQSPASMTPLGTALSLKGNSH